MGEQYLRCNLNGNKFNLHYKLNRKSKTGSARGDHGYGDYEYEYSIWDGRVFVHEKSNNDLVAVCLCGIGRYRTASLSSKEVEELIVGKNIVPGRQEDFNDFMAEVIIYNFRSYKGEFIPWIEITEPNYGDLILRGIVFDKGRQFHFPFDK